MPFTKILLCTVALVGAKVQLGSSLRGNERGLLTIEGMGLFKGNFREQSPDMRHFRDGGLLGARKLAREAMNFRHERGLTRASMRFRRGFRDGSADCKLTPLSVVPSPVAFSPTVKRLPQFWSKQPQNDQTLIGAMQSDRKLHGLPLRNFRRIGAHIPAWDLRWRR